MDFSAATLITINGILCSDEGTREEMGRQASWAERYIRCNWSDRVTLTDYFRGKSVVIAGFAVRTPAQAYAAYPYLFVESVGCVGDGKKGQDANGVVAYDSALLTVRYTADEDLQTGALSIDFASEIVTLPNAVSVLKFSDDSTDVPPDCNPSLIIPGQSISKTLTRLAELPIAAIKAAGMAPLNSTAFLGFDAKTVLFDGGHSDQAIMTDGSNLITLTYRFRWRPIPWDQVLGVDGTWRTVLKKNGDPLIPTSDLNDLLV